MSDLKQRSVRGAAVTMFGQGAKFVLQLSSMMVLARLLTPEDFGLIAMVTVVTGFILIFKDMGLSMATVQRPQINHDQISTLFWLNMAFSLVLMLVTLASAQLVAGFFNEPRLFDVTLVLSMAFLFGGLTVQHQALLRRQMKLTAITIIDVTAMAAGIFVAILCAVAGLGYWALVWMQIATAFVNAVGVWVASGWRPGWAVRGSGVREMLKFGGYMTGFSIVNFFARNADNLLIGHYLGAQQLGLYSRAYSLLLFPIGQITAPMTAVAIPALSRLQNEPERYRSYYLKAIRIIAYISFPFVAALAVLSKEVIELILGDQWSEAAPVFQILAISAVFQPVANTVGWIYVSMGQTKRMAKWGVFSSILIVTSFLVGLSWGIIGVATCYAIITIILIHPQLAFATASSPLGPLDIYKVVYRPLFLGITIGLFMGASKYLFPSTESISTILIAFVFGGTGALISVGIISIVKKDLREIVATFGDLRNADKSRG